LDGSNTLFVGSDDMNVYAVDAQTGQQKGLYHLPAQPEWLSVGPGALYVTLFDGRLYVLS